jgi:hypothetical protein
MSSLAPVAGLFGRTTPIAMPPDLAVETPSPSREWSVTGRLLGPDGGAAPGAEVVASTVYWSGGGYHSTVRATATTGADGSFALSFPWSEQCHTCWPCEPIWWLWWPWWWERDILHVIDALETRMECGALTTPFRRPSGAALVQGRGFGGADAAAGQFQDPARTALIRQKFADRTLREAFPWFWWSSDQPNLVFRVTQGASTILDEDPTTDTRWCMSAGQSVTLTGNADTLTIRPVGPVLAHAVAWNRVGDIHVSDIDGCGLARDTGDWVDVAFAGWLELYATLAPGACDYYQVQAGVWDAPSCRGGSRPDGTGRAIASTLWQKVWIFDPATLATTAHDVKMGPFSANGVENLYATQYARQTLPAPAGLPAFPPVPPGGEVFWAHEGLVLATDGATLLGGIPFGTVDLRLAGYSSPARDGADFRPSGLVMDKALMLTIDETPLSHQSIESIKARDAIEAGVADATDIVVHVRDDNGFVFGYELEARLPHGIVLLVTPPGTRGYVTNPGSKPDYEAKLWRGGKEAIRFPGYAPDEAPAPDCTIEFCLYAGKRTTDGYAWPSLTEGDTRRVAARITC